MGLFYRDLFRSDIFQAFFPPEAGLPKARSAQADLPAVRQIRIITTETRRKDKKEEIFSN